MCKLSNKLRLCTCQHSDADKLLHYWILKRPAEEHYMLVGETLLPATMPAEVHKINLETLRTLLNAGQCFDVAPALQENDVIEFYFNLDDPKATRRALQFAFRFKGGKWLPADIAAFDNSLTPIQAGEIAQPFEG